jgi:hypothetical protein
MGIAAWAWGIHMNLGETGTARAYVEQNLRIWPDNHDILIYLSRWDIDDGRPDLALARWEKRDPGLADMVNREIDQSNVWDAVDYAHALKAAGEGERARNILLRCRSVELRGMRDIHGYTLQARIHALLGNRQETLNILRTLVIDKGWRRLWWIREKREFDFLQDDPEFQRLTGIMREDLDGQLERLREMARSGELDPAPGLVLVHE